MFVLRACKTSHDWREQEKNILNFTEKSIFANVQLSLEMKGNSVSSQSKNVRIHSNSSFQFKKVALLFPVSKKKKYEHAELNVNRYVNNY